MRVPLSWLREYVEIQLTPEQLAERLTLLGMEVKGLEREADRSKDVGAKRWIDAVNHWGKLGHWRYAKIHSPHDLISVLGDDPGPGAPR